MKSATHSIARPGFALAVALLDARGFRPEDFARSHPGGALGRRLLTRVADVMRTGAALPQIALRERGIHFVQGYIFAPPLPGTSFLRLLEATDHQAQLGETRAPAAMSFGFGYLSSRRRANAA